MILMCLNELAPTLVFEAFSSFTNTELLCLLTASPYHEIKHDLGYLVPIEGGTSLYLPLIAALQQRAMPDDTEEMLFTRELRGTIKIKKSEPGHPFKKPKRTSGLREALAKTLQMINDKIGPESRSGRSTPFEEVGSLLRVPSPESASSGGVVTPDSLRV